MNIGKNEIYHDIGDVAMYGNALQEMYDARTDAENNVFLSEGNILDVIEIGNMLNVFGGLSEMERVYDAMSCYIINGEPNSYDNIDSLYNAWVGIGEWSKL